MENGTQKLEVPSEIPLPPATNPSQLHTLEEVERSHIVAVLQRTGGVIEGQKGAAIILNLHPNTLRHRMKKFGIRPSDHRLS